MRFSDACFIKYCRAKKTTEKFKIHAEYKVLRTEIKMKTKEAKKNITRIYSKKIDLSKNWEPFALLSKLEEKVNTLHAL